MAAARSSPLASAEAFFRHDAVREKLESVLAYLTSKHPGLVTDGIDAAALARNAGTHYRTSFPSFLPFATFVTLVWRTGVLSQLHAHTLLCLVCVCVCVCVCAPSNSPLAAAAISSHKSVPNCSPFSSLLLSMNRGARQGAGDVVRGIWIKALGDAQVACECGHFSCCILS